MKIATKRILSVLLCLCMLLSIVPVGSAARGNVVREATAADNEAAVTIGGITREYPGLNNAILAVAEATVEDEAVVTVLRDIDLGNSYQEILSGVFTIDLNGFEIGSTAYNHGTLNVTGGNVTVTDSGTTGKIIGNYMGVEVSDADLTVFGGSINAETYGLYVDCGTLTVDGGNISGGNDGVYAYENSTVNISGGSISGDDGVDAHNNSTVNISGGSISANYYGVFAYASTVTIGDGNISGGDTGVDAHDNSTVNISGGTISGEKYYGVGAFDATVTISDGDISGGDIGLHTDGCIVDISGGSVSGGSSGAYVVGGSVNISDGNIVATGENSPNSIFALYANRCSEVTISGGSFSGSGIDNYGYYACGILAFETTVTVSGGSIYGEGADIRTSFPVALTLGENGEGATFPGGITVESTTLNAILGEGMAFWQGDKMIVPEEDATEIIGGDVVIKAVCTHENATLAYTNNGADHTATYSCCGTSFTEPHSYDSETMLCACGATCADMEAFVTIGDTVTYYNNFFEAIDAVEDCTADDEAVVTVLKDIDLDEAEYINSGVFTLDLNGCSITSAGTAGLDLYGSEVDLTIIDSGEDGSIVCTGDYGIFSEYSALTINGGTISGEDKGVVADGGTLNIKGGTISGSVSGVYAVDGSVNISDGSIIATGEGSPYSIYALYVNGCSEVTVSGGTISGSGIDSYGDYADGIFAYDTTLTISGGSIWGEGADIFAPDAPLTLTLGVGGEGATFPGGITVKDTTLKAILGEGAAYWQGDKMIVPKDNATEIADGDVVIKVPCAHENATVSYTANVDDHTCIYSCCGAAVKELHTPDDDGICTLCGFDPSTVIIINMTDTAFDSWNGAAIQVHENGELIATVTIDDGDSAAWATSYDPEKAYEFRWVKGEHDPECSFEILFGLETVFTATCEDCYGFADGYCFFTKCPHSYDDGVVTAPTCTEEGYTTYTCALCGESFDDDYVDALGHDFGDDGVCTLCGAGSASEITIHMTDAYGDGWNGGAIEVYEDGELIATATINNGNSATWTGPCNLEKEYTFRWVKGNYDSECSFEILFGTETVFTATVEDCSGFRDGYLFYPVCEHLYDNGVVTAPTCTADGYTTYTCALCGDSYESEFVIALGHTLGEGVVTAPTCTEEGYTTYICAVCGESYDDDYVDALGHDFGDDGVCTVCGFDPSKIITINMTDDYGDGWNGNAIEVYEDGELIATVTIEDGETATWSGEYDPEKEYTFYWVEGNFDEECAFTIYVGGEVFFEAEVGDCVGIGNGAQFTADGIIPGESGGEEDPDENMSFSIVMVDVSGNGWGGCGIEVYANGERLGFFTLEEGEMDQGLFGVYSPDVVYEFYWVAGEAPEECEFVLLLGNEPIYVAEAGTCAEFTDGQLIFSTEGLGEEEEDDGDVYVAGVALNSGEYLDLDGNVTTTCPDGGYAYYDGSVLTLSDYSYIGALPLNLDIPGLICTKLDALQIELLGTNTLATPDEELNGIRLGIVVGSMAESEKGALTVSGTGTLNMTESTLAAVMADSVTLTGGTWNIAAYAGISSSNGDSAMTVNGGELNITASGEEYAECIRIGHFTLNNGRVILSNSAYLALEVGTLTVNGGYLEVKQGGMEACDRGEVTDLITLAEGVSITSPEGAVIADTTNSNGLFAQTIHNVDGTVADAFVISILECEHDWDDGVVTAPTCTEDGYTTYTCALCGEEYIGDQVPRMGHTTDENDICTVCGADCSDMRIYFLNEQDWDKVLLYYWKDNYGQDFAWPGLPMELYGNDGTHDIYVMEVPCDTVGIIINNGAVHTGDLMDFYDGICYYPDSSSKNIAEVLHSGWTQIDGQWYYVDPESGEKVTGIARVPYPTEEINGITYAPDQEAIDYYEAKGETFIDETEGWFAFGDDGVFMSELKAIFHTADGKVYIENGFAVWNPGLVELEDGYYYFIGDEENGGNKPAVGNYYIGKNNTDLDIAIGGVYTFGEDGKLCEYDGITDIDGVLYYYEDYQLMLGKGLIATGGTFYYVRSDGTLVVGQKYWVANTNGYKVTVGEYDFDETGKLIFPEKTEKHGIYFEKGGWYYYENGKKAYSKGLVSTTLHWYDADGNDVWGEGGIIYVRSDGRLATGRYYISNIANFDGALDAKVGMALNFNDMGLYIAPKNGIYADADGILRYYINDVMQYNSGVIVIDDNYYYVRSNGIVVSDCTYWITNVGSSGVIAGEYVFDENGVMQDPQFEGEAVLNGIANGYYYVDGKIAYNKGLTYLEAEGCYIYVRSNGMIALGKYWITNHHDLLPAGMYDFGTDGKLYR